MAVIITTHLRERFVQRTNKKYLHVQDCRENGCLICKRLLAEIFVETRVRKEELDKIIQDQLAESKEDRSYLNNSGFMEWYYNKYGFDKRFEFLVHGSLLFVIVWDNGERVGVTCVLAKTHLAGKSVLRRVKYRKK